MSKLREKYLRRKLQQQHGQSAEISSSCKIKESETLTIPISDQISNKCHSLQQSAPVKSPPREVKFSNFAREKPPIRQLSTPDGEEDLLTLLASYLCKCDSQAAVVAGSPNGMSLARKREFSSFPFPLDCSTLARRLRMPVKHSASTKFIDSEKVAEALLRLASIVPRINERPVLELEDVGMFPSLTGIDSHALSNWLNSRRATASAGHAAAEGAAKKSLCPNVFFNSCSSLNSSSVVRAIDQRRTQFFSERGESSQSQDVLNLDRIDNRQQNVSLHSAQVPYRPSLPHPCQHPHSFEKAVNNPVFPTPHSSSANASFPPVPVLTADEGLESLLSAPSVRERELVDSTESLRKLLSEPTAKQTLTVQTFQNKGGTLLREFCPQGTRIDCIRASGCLTACSKVHFRRIIAPHTDVSLGDCSYLDTCRHKETCKFVHYEVDICPSDFQSRFAAAESKVREIQRPHDIGAVSAAPLQEVGAQWIRCDLRSMDFTIFGPNKVKVVMADPPWDIHMDLPYGTMTDQEMRELRVDHIQEEGLLFLWVTGRAMELGRECMKIWGYSQVEEIVWVKTNQLQRIIRTGRTGHWLNHSKEHCLVGIKGSPVVNRNIDCDVIVAEVRETSRKPDEIYRIIERLMPGSYKVELFGRQHNVRKNWITLGNQLDGVELHDPEIISRYETSAPRLGLPSSLPPPQPTQPNDVPPCDASSSRSLSPLLANGKSSPFFDSTLSFPSFLSKDNMSLSGSSASCVTSSSLGVQHAGADCSSLGTLPTSTINKAAVTDGENGAFNTCPETNSATQSTGVAAGDCTAAASSATNVTIIAGTSSPSRPMDSSPFQSSGKRLLNEVGVFRGSCGPKESNDNDDRRAVAPVLNSEGGAGVRMQVQRTGSVNCGISIDFDTLIVPTCDASKGTIHKADTNDNTPIVVTSALRTAHSDKCRQINAGPTNGI